MIIFLSPAKTLDFKIAGAENNFSHPEFSQEANIIARQIKKMTVAELGKLMKISSKLSYEVYEWYQDWTNKADPLVSKQAVMAYRGDAYRGLDAASLSEASLEWAQDHLRILSGLYGMLRPLDLILPYRLEFATKIAIGQYKDLYSFWNDHLKRSFFSLINTEGSHILVNLASAEYYKALKDHSADLRVITPVFKEFRNGEYRFFSMFGKRARGLMTRYIIERRIVDPEEMKLFNAEGYSFNAPLSGDDEWIFTR